MGAPAVRAALGTALVLLLGINHDFAAAQTTTVAAGTTAAAPLWIMVPMEIKVAVTYDPTWMTDKESAQFQQLAADTVAAITPLIDAEFGDQHVLSAVDGYGDYLDRIKIFLNCTLKTTVTLESELDLGLIDTKLKEVIRLLKSVGEYQVNGGSVNKDDYVVVEPFTITTVAQTTVREKRSTTAMNTTTVTESASAVTESSTTAAAESATTAAERATTAAAESATTAAESSTTAAAQTSTTAAENATTDAENATTDAENATTSDAATAANTTAPETNATTEAANMTTVSTTTQPTTTEAPPPVSAKLSCVVRITSISYQDWMALPFTNQYSDLANAVEQVSQPVLVDKFGDDFRSVAVTGFRSGSVLVDMEVVVMTDKTRAEDVDAKTLSEETTVALQNLMEEGDFIFDPSAVETSEEIEVIEPTTSPAPTEDPYRHTIMRFEMRAPFANWTDDLNDTDSEAFANMEQEVQAGVELMLSKKYPKGEWNVSSYILWMSNATEDVEDDTTEPQGVKINFVVTVEPQMTNTSKIVQELARSFVFFNKLGTLQIAPDSVYFKDLTTYAPGMGVVIMDADYLRALRKTQYNGSFVGDFTTQPPTLQPVIKRHKGFVLGIAVPAFIGMIAAIGLLLICTTIAGAKKSDD